MTITVDTMRNRLHPLDFVREVLARTEPLTSRPFTVGDSVRFVISLGWGHGIDAKAGTDLVDASIQLGKGFGFNEYRLTKDALLEATSFCGLRKGYAARYPADLLERELNHWFREGLLTRVGAPRDFQLLIAKDVGAAITRATVEPFSNLKLMDEALKGIEAKYGTGEVLVDYKFSHSLKRTHLRLIVPEYIRAMTGTGTDGDTWSVGLQLKNSLIGADKTSIDGYLFRWACTNGAIDTRATSGAWTRRAGANVDEVYEWARHAVDEVLGGLEPALDAVQALVNVPIQGQVADILRDIFTHYRVPLPERDLITKNVLEMGADNMYTIMAAITNVANNTTMDPSHIENLLRLGGQLPHDLDRCDSCLRLNLQH